MKIISGMHRSGTSIVARLFYEAGADMGDPRGFYPGNRWNPDGYFEQKDIHTVNMPLINGPWGKFSYLKLPSEMRIMKRGVKLKEKIIELGKKYDGNVVKEARFSLTLPVYLKYKVNIEKLIINIREPVEVALSLRKRNHIPLAIGLKLWHEHNRRLLDYVVDIPHVILNYNRLLSEEGFFIELKSAFEFFDIQASDFQIRTFKENYINNTMNHNKKDHYKYPVYIQEMWHRLNEEKKSNGL
jgi:hypothetical protein